MAKLGAIWADDLWDVGIWDTAIWAGDFTLLSAQVASDGGSVRIGFSSNANVGAGGNGGFAVTLSGGACPVSR